MRRVHELALHRHLRAGDGGVRERSDCHDSGFKHVRRRAGPESYDSGAAERGKKRPLHIPTLETARTTDSVHFRRSREEYWLILQLVLWA